MGKHIISIDSSRCTGCGKCVSDCAGSNIDIVSKKAHIVSNDCIMCGHCVAVCAKC